MGTAMVQTGAGVAAREEFSGTEVVRQAETAQSALMAQQRAMVEARFLVAMKMKRNWLNVRATINQLCRDPEFAAEAEYVKPISRTPDGWNDLSKREKLQTAPDAWPRGFSIRFIESVLFEAGNFHSSATIIWEDDQKRLTQVSVMDLEKNSGYDGTILTPKTVERSKVYEGQEVLAVRENSLGKRVYIVAATADQVTQSEAAAKSKMLRTLGEKLLPPHYKREWRSIIDTTIMDELARDPEAQKKKILDAFTERGVMPSSLEVYLGHTLDSLQPAEMAELRRVYSAISEGEATWADVMEAKFGNAAADQEKKPEPSKAATALREKLAKKEPQKPEAKQPEPEVVKQQAATQAKPPAAQWQDVVHAYGTEEKAIRALASRGFESWSQVNASDRPGLAAKLIQEAAK